MTQDFIPEPLLIEVINNQSKAIEASSRAWQTTTKTNDKLVDLVVTLMTKRSVSLYSAQNTPISEQTNWFCPLYQNHTRCFICHYFGHGIDACPNITKLASEHCIRCWKKGHASSNCPLPIDQASNPPFKPNFIYPSDLLKKILFT